MLLQNIGNKLQFKESASNYVIMMVAFGKKEKGQYKVTVVTISYVILKSGNI